MLQQKVCVFLIALSAVGTFVYFEFGNVIRDSAYWVDFSSMNRRPFVEKNPDDNCTEDFKRSHYIQLKCVRGRTGNVLIQIFGLLATSKTFCYTPVILPTDWSYKRSIASIFDLKNIKFIEMNTSTLGRLGNVLFNSSQGKLVKGQHNFTLGNRCIDYNLFLSQEAFIRSSISFKRHIKRKTTEYINECCVNKTTVAIHVRRTDRVGYSAGKYVYNNLEWYTEYIDEAMDYLKSKYVSLAFIFVSDDIEWCKKRFPGTDVYFSTFTSAGYDLNLMSRCDHVVLTVGTFGWCGAMLGKPKSVLYSRKYAMPRFTSRNFFLPSWIEI